MNEKQIAEIEARANAATPGPWITTNRAIDVLGQMAIAWTGNDIYVSTDWKPGGGIVSDSIFISNARSDIPALIAEVRRLRDVVAAYADRINWQRDALSHADLWIADWRGYTRARKCLREDGE